MELNDRISIISLLSNLSTDIDIDNLYLYLNNNGYLPLDEYCKNVGLVIKDLKVLNDALIERRWASFMPEVESQNILISEAMMDIRDTKNVSNYTSEVLTSYLTYDKTKKYNIN